MDAALGRQLPGHRVFFVWTYSQDGWQTHGPMRNRALTGFLLFLTGMCPLKARVFTDNKGRQMDAEILSKQGGQVRIRRADGKEFTVPANSFSPADQAFINAWQPAAAAPKAPVVAPPKDSSARKHQRFVEDVVYVIEKGDNEPFSRRWIALPNLVMQSTDPALQKQAEVIFADICKEAGLVEAPKGGGDMVVHIGPSRELNKIAKEEKVLLTPSTRHQFWMWWNEYHQLTRAVIFLCTDRVEGPEAIDTLRRDMVAAIGFPSRSAEVDDCCMSKKSSLLSGLTDIDRKIIHFYYTQVPPGTKPAEFKRIFKEQWRP